MAGSHIAARGHGAYDVYKLFEVCEKLPIVEIPFEELEPALDVRIWMSSDESLAFSPRHLVKHMVLDTDHWNRMLAADLSYPILVFDISANWAKLLENQSYRECVSMLLYGNYDVIDGNHRLAKCFLSGVKMVKAKVVTWEVLQEARLVPDVMDEQ
jgi:hypothetical protein